MHRTRNSTKAIPIWWRFATRPKETFRAPSGLAIAEAYLAARYNRPGFELTNRFTYALASDGDRMGAWPRQSKTLFLFCPMPVGSRSAFSREAQTGGAHMPGVFAKCTIYGRRSCTLR